MKWLENNHIVLWMTRVPCFPSRLLRLVISDIHHRWRLRAQPEQTELLLKEEARPTLPPLGNPVLCRGHIHLPSLHLNLCVVGSVPQEDNSLGTSAEKYKQQAELRYFRLKVTGQNGFQYPGYFKVITAPTGLENWTERRKNWKSFFEEPLVDKSSVHKENIRHCGIRFF